MRLLNHSRGHDTEPFTLSAGSPHRDRIWGDHGLTHASRRTLVSHSTLPWLCLHSTNKAHGPCSVLALDKTALDRALLEYGAFEILATNTKELARRMRLQSAKSKFRRAVRRLRTSTMLKGNVTPALTTVGEECRATVQMRSCGLPLVIGSMLSSCLE